MNKQMEMGKTMFEVMKMRKNNKQNPFPLRKYYGAMIIGFVFFLGIMAYYSATFRQRRDQANRKSAWKKNRSELITAQHRKKQKQQRKTRKKQRQRHK